MKKYLLCIACLLFCVPLLQAQDTITLAQCQKAALANYPLARQKGLYTQTGEAAISNLKANRWLPQMSVNGQASWQSEVTRLPIEVPGVQVPELSKDQYKITLDAGYTLYDGGVNRFERELQKTSTAREVQGIEVELNRVKSQVNLYFLNALLAEENSKLMAMQQTHVKNQIDKLSANVTYGTAPQTTVDALQAEYLQLEQKLSEFKALRNGFKEMLAILTGLSIDENTTLGIEQEEISIQNLPNQRPEMKLYGLQRSQLAVQQGLVSSRIQPRVSAFAQTGAGRPALNLLNNDFRSFFLGGVRLSWTLSNGYTLKRERTILSLKEQMVNNQQATFEKNLSLELRQQQSEIERYQYLLEQDTEIVALRSKLRQRAASQLENGAIAARDYISELNAENQARLNLNTHRVQWQMAKLQYLTLTGN
ncbi:TolC family protein [Rhodocytophaga aerolata]|uniref:TolC family protein n=1 Tax=Rhodocytophaga aerolata TaxID=455078 RepID=A0ABT8RF70_9BACT|nr:TolC family protein [Rhodocytophaga aerolata]MDO1449367.1 TolC family protein [Rhodocytophaga aerolata]